MERGISPIPYERIFPWKNTQVIKEKRIDLRNVFGEGLLDRESRYHTLLKDPARRKIIEVLGDREKIGFRELKEVLGLGVGTVYYHLDMLSGYLEQDKQRKYRLSDRGRLLFKSMREGQVPVSLDVGETFRLRLVKWLFLSPLFAKTTRPLKFLPFSLLILGVGAFGSALASCLSLLLFYSSFTVYQFEITAFVYLFNWVSLFIFSDLVISFGLKRVGGDLQLFVCLGIASFPVALFPYLYFFLSYEVARYFLLVIVVWEIILLSSAFSFSKGLRLDKSIVLSLCVFYVNIVVLLVTGQFA